MIFTNYKLHTSGKQKSENNYLSLKLINFQAKKNFMKDDFHEILY